MGKRNWFKKAFMSRACDFAVWWTQKHNPKLELIAFTALDHIKFRRHRIAGGIAKYNPSENSPRRYVLKIIEEFMGGTK